MLSEGDEGDFDGMGDWGCKRKGGFMFGGRKK